MHLAITCAFHSVLFALAGPPPGETAVPPVLSSEQILAKMAAMNEARVSQLDQYDSMRHYALENKRFRTSAEMTVKARYFRPGRKEFAIVSESGAALVRQRVFRTMLDSELEASDGSMRRATQITPENYIFDLVGTDSDRGRPAYVFTISPKVVNKFSIKGRLWLDAEDFAISRLEGQPAKNPSFWLRSTKFVHTYRKFGPFWLAVSNISQTDGLIFGHTAVEILYSDYTITQVESQKPGAELPTSLSQCGNRPFFLLHAVGYQDHAVAGAQGNGLGFLFGFGDVYPKRATRVPESVEKLARRLKSTSPL